MLESVAADSIEIAIKSLVGLYHTFVHSIFKWAQADNEF